MPRLRKVSIKDPPEVKSQKKPKGKEKPAKKLKQEPHWMQGDGLSVAQLILSIQKTDCNNAKVIKELKKLYKKVNLTRLDVLLTFTGCLIFNSWISFSR